MILGRPWALALLAIPVLLLLFRLRRNRPRIAEASSLLVWEKVSPSDTQPARPRPPLSAWLEAAGAAVIVVGLASPWGPPAEAVGAIDVLLDMSKSMKARGADGRTRLDTARAAVPREDTIRIRESFDPVGDLAMFAKGAPVVVLTDRRLPGVEDVPGRLRIVGVGKPGFNAGITDASGVPLSDGRWRVLLTIEAHGATGPVEGRLRIGEREESITVAPGTPLEIVRELSGMPISESVEARVAFAGDVLKEDDDAGMRDLGSCEVYVGGTRFDPEAPLGRALLSAGATHDSPLLDVAGVIVHGEFSHYRQWRLIELPPRSQEQGSWIRGDSVVASDDPLLRDVRIDPGVTLGRRVLNRLPGRPILSDGEGPLVTRDGPWSGHTLRFAFHPGGSWVERDPSFVVFAANIVDEQRGRSRGLLVSSTPSPVETREAAEGESFGDLAAALAEMRRPDPATRKPLAAIVLGAGAALLAAAWYAAEFAAAWYMKM